MKIYMLGIKGSGMSALAVLLKEYGEDVSGCDREDYIFTQENLDKHNIKYTSEIVYDSYDFVIKGNSYNGEFNFTCPVYKYVDVLKYLSNRYKSIAVCGSHGKTTTTGMLSTIINDGYLIGDGSGYLSSDSKYFVFEACEYKRNFLNYNPNIILINNLDLDHIDYFKSMHDYVSAFETFKKKAKDAVIVNGDDINLAMFDNCLKFGFNSNNDLIITKYNQTGKGMTFSFKYKGKDYVDVSLPLFGIHQLYNAVGSIFVSLYLGFDIEFIKERLNKYKFNNRRFNIEEIESNVIVDDYGHQPHQLEATLSSIKIKYPDKKVVCIFKPDRYSRVYYFMDDFKAALYKFDEAYICNFPSCSISDLSFEFSSSNVIDERIKLFDEKDYSIFKNRKNTVFLVTSSKYVNNIKERIKERLVNG